MSPVIQGYLVVRLFLLQLAGHSRLPRVSLEQEG
jgi:hypothetical protein